MKHWQSQIFPVILLALLAALTFWLSKVNSGDTPAPTGKLRHDPDAIAENFIARRFDQTGNVKYRLTAPYLEHFPDDDSSIVTSPILISFRPDAAPVTVKGKNAKVSSKGETIYIWDTVSIARAATPERPAMIAQMPDLTAQPDLGIAFTSSPVEIQQGESWLKGVGAHLDNNTSTLVLQSQVTGLYIRPKTSP